MIFIDSNIFLRYFEKEDELGCRKIERLFTEIINGNITGVSTSLAIAEVVWVLNKFYNWEKEEICNNINLILRTPNIIFKERAILLEAINTYAERNVSFIDAYDYSFMKANNVVEIYSLDRDFDKLPDIKRLKP
jgi:predicted nucleic-acid-binding protein